MSDDKYSWYSKRATWFYVWLGLLVGVFVSITAPEEGGFTIKQILTGMIYLVVAYLNVWVYAYRTERRDHQIERFLATAPVVYLVQGATIGALLLAPSMYRLCVFFAVWAFTTALGYMLSLA